MTARVRNIILTDLTPHWTGTATGYQMAYLSAEHKRALALTISMEYAIRIDGQTASLVRCCGAYTAHKSEAVIVEE